MKTRLYKEFFHIFLGLFLFLAVVWGAFYVVVSQIISEANLSRINQTANELLNDLSDNIEKMEQISYSISNKDIFVEFFNEKDIIMRHVIAKEIFSSLQNDLLAIGGRYSIIAIDNNGWFYRFSGNINNKECEKLAIDSYDMAFSTHLSITLNGVNYIGYASEILNNYGDSIGKIFVVENEENLIEYFHDVDSDQMVAAAILSDDVVISSNAKYVINEELPLFTKKQVGVTSFQVATWLNPDYDEPTNIYFILSIASSMFFMIVIIIMFARYQRKKFLEPIIHVMTEVDKINFESIDRLQFVQSEEFDNLITKINNLVNRLDKQSEEVKNSMLLVEKAKTQSERAINFSLKKQINAHFIVNTLNTIQVLSKHNRPEESERAILYLSEIIRYAFSQDDDITVWDELSHLRKYCEIMNIRYDNKIVVEIDADDRLMDVMMPRMILQPIVENSILHGFANHKNNCFIKIDAQYLCGKVLISIKDNGCGISEERLFELNGTQNFEDDFNSEGMDKLNTMAIQNVKRRLIANDKKSDFTMKSKIGEGTETIISFFIDDEYEKGGTACENV